MKRSEYEQRLTTEGKAQADAWLDQHGREYRAGLVAEGKC